MKKYYGNIFLVFTALGFPMGLIITLLLGFTEHFFLLAVLSSIFWAIIFGGFYTALMWLFYDYWSFKRVWQIFLFSLFAPLLLLNVIMESYFRLFVGYNCPTCFATPEFALFWITSQLFIPSCIIAAILSAFAWKANRLSQTYSALEKNFD